jgi:hypothetical protein
MDSCSYREGDVMAKIIGISNVDTANSYSTNATRSNSDNTDFSSYLGETQSLDAFFDKAADKYNVPVELLKAVGKAESNFDPDAVSRCGAQGIMQLMPSTAKGLGVTDSFDPEQNIMGGAKYIAGLLKKYGGNTSLTLAAYNAGSGNVAKYGGIPPFEETQNYVKKIIGFLKKSGVDTTGNSSDSAVAESTSGKSYLHVASVAVPTQTSSNYAYLLNGSNSGDPATDLDTLFNYDDYMKFLDLFMKDKDEEDTNENNMNYNMQDINYNATVLNLMKDMNN